MLLRPTDVHCQLWPTGMLCCELCICNKKVHKFQIIPILIVVFISGFSESGIDFDLRSRGFFIYLLRYLLTEFMSDEILKRIIIIYQIDIVLYCIVYWEYLHIYWRFQQMAQYVACTKFSVKWTDSRHILYYWLKMFPFYLSKHIPEFLP